MTELREKAESVWKKGLCRGRCRTVRTPQSFCSFFHLHHWWHHHHDRRHCLLHQYNHQSCCYCDFHDCLCSRRWIKRMSKETEIHSTSDMYLHHTCVSPFSTDTLTPASNSSNWVRINLSEPSGPARIQRTSLWLVEVSKFKISWILGEMCLKWCTKHQKYLKKGIEYFRKIHIHMKQRAGIRR